MTVYPLAHIAVGLALAATTAHAGEVVGKAVSVHDGDTLTILVERQQVKVRLASIDAPELDQPLGLASRDKLASICAGGTAYIENQGRDHRGRTLGQVRCGSLDANAEQVRRSMAWVYPRYAPKESRLNGLQAHQGEYRGLWAGPHRVSQWEWRRVRA